MKSEHFEDPFLKILPTLDVHGEYRDTVVVPVRAFLNENFHKGKEKIAVIHGRGSHILKNEIHEYLKRETKVKKFYTYNFNDGITIIELKSKKEF